MTRYYLDEVSIDQEITDPQKLPFKREWLFADGTENFVTPMEAQAGETVCFRFRTAAANVDVVYFCTEDKKLPMVWEKTEGSFDYYCINYVMPTEKLQYCFQIKAENTTCYFTRLGVQDEFQDHQAFVMYPGFRTPDWAKGAVMYQIYVDRFCNGNPDNDVETGEYHYINGPAVACDWDAMPTAVGYREFYGGDLDGVLQKMDYLQELGIEAIYFNPLFVSPSSHKYDTQDYDYIDPHFGRIVTEEEQTEQPGSNAEAKRYISRTTHLDNLEASNALFIEVVEAAHARGIKVILDGVFNHCGSFNKWMDRERMYEPQAIYPKGAYVSEDSPYRDFFHFHHQNWSYNDDYEGWWGHKTLPKLNYEGSRNLEDYIIEIGKKWVSPPFNADGWRLDVAADLGHSVEYNHLFWKRFRRAVKEAKPDAIILAEHYGDAGDWLRGDQWDTVMNYDAFMEPLTWFLTGMEKHSDRREESMQGNAGLFKEMMDQGSSRMTMPSKLVAMNQLSNHDHSRFLTRTNYHVGRVEQLGSEAASRYLNYGIFREAVVMQMTWPGAPTLYYGDEVGVVGFTDPDNRRTFPWGRENNDLLLFHKDVIALHKSLPSLRLGSLMYLKLDHNVLAYARFYGNELAVMVFNNRPQSETIEVPVEKLGLQESDCLLLRLMSFESGYHMDKELFRIHDGLLYITLPAHGAAVLTNAE